MAPELCRKVIRIHRLETRLEVRLHFKRNKFNVKLREMLGGILFLSLLIFVMETSCALQKAARAGWGSKPFITLPHGRITRVRTITFPRSQSIWGILRHVFIWQNVARVMCVMGFEPLSKSTKDLLHHWALLPTFYCERNIQSKHESALSICGKIFNCKIEKEASTVLKGIGSLYRSSRVVVGLNVIIKQ